MGWTKWLAGIVLAVVQSAAIAVPPSSLSAPVTAGQRAILDRDLEISLAIKPNKGDAWTRLALRLTGDAANWKRIAEQNGLGDNLVTDREILVPFSLLRPELRRKVITALFPEDRAARNGWSHRVVAGTIEGESLWRIAEWFTGDGANYAAIRAANDPARLSTRRGDTILVPASILSSEFRTADAPVRHAAPAATAATQAEDDPEDQGSGGAIAQAAEVPSPAGPISLEYDLTSQQPNAVYRLQRGEALYSSVAIRFTGRVYARDVNEVVDQIVRFNGIADVAKLPVGYPVRIPLELLTPEYRPLNDPRRVAEEESKRESARVAKRVAARNLKGVQIILDAGHGGRDVGTSHEGIWESDYVYDVACRLKRELEKKTDAKVWMTTRSREGGYAISSGDRLERRSDRLVLTSPRYELENPVIGVHLRWYLANSIFRRAIAKSVPPEKVVFISIHADSLHPSLRGAMAYVPGEQYVQGTFAKSGRVYLARSEVRESPSVTQTEEEALRAEGLSTALAQSIIGSFGKSDLLVHTFNPIRDNVVRSGREWVPAVIRYNKVPTRLLLEICNLGNERDRRLLGTARYRQGVADAIRKGVVDYFARQKDQPVFELTSRTAAAGK